MVNVVLGNFIDYFINYRINYKEELKCIQLNSINLHKNK